MKNCRAYCAYFIQEKRKVFVNYPPNDEFMDIPTSNLDIAERFLGKAERLLEKRQVSIDLTREFVNGALIQAMLYMKNGGVAETNGQHLLEIRLTAIKAKLAEIG